MFEVVVEDAVQMQVQLKKVRRFQTSVQLVSTGLPAFWGSLLNFIIPA
jgi:hypothetical protein